MTKKKLILFSLISIVILFLGWIFINSNIKFPQQHYTPQHIIKNSIDMGGDFTLMDHHGKEFKLSQTYGKPTLMYFGFTHCPDFCPAALQIFDQVDEILGDNLINRIFISIDPNRDTSEHLNQYVSLFNKGLIGLTGSKEMIKKTAKLWNVYYASHQKNEQDQHYTVDHVTYYYLLNKQGKLEAFIKPDASPKDIARYIQENILDQ